MNERVMQFRIGMFVIVAGLVLTMLIVWFGESPALLRDQLFLRARYSDAPGVLEGVAVRKSGIRVGEVSAIQFDYRPNQPDGVLVTMAIERKYSIRKGSVPRLSRSLIGDVTIDLLPGTGQVDLELGALRPKPRLSMAKSPPIPQRPWPRPLECSKSSATRSRRSTRQPKAWPNSARTPSTSTSSSRPGPEPARIFRRPRKSIDQFIKTNENDLRATVVNLQKVGEKLNNTLTPETQDALKTGIAKIASASARLDGHLADLGPLLKDLGSPVNHTPTTDFGQTVRRVNRVAADVELLSATLRNRKGALNTDGSIQKLLTQSDLYDNFNLMAVNASQAISQLKIVLTSFRTFAERLSRDPSAISRGILSR